MKAMFILGIALIVIGAAVLGYDHYSYTTTDEVLKIGPITATAERTHTVALPPFLGWLLGKTFDDLNPSDRFGQTGVHRAKARPQQPCHRAQKVVVTAQGQRQSRQENQRHQQQIEVERGNRNQGNDQREGRFRRHAQRRADKLVDLLHIVGDARHQITNALAAMKGLTFAQQTEIKLIAGVAFDALGEHADRHAVNNIKETITHIGRQYQQRCDSQR